MATGLIARRLAGRLGERAGKLGKGCRAAGKSGGRAGKLGEGWPEGLKKEGKL
jgi:hypothetical protein